MSRLIAIIMGAVCWMIRAGWSFVGRVRQTRPSLPVGRALPVRSGAQTMIRGTLTALLLAVLASTAWTSAKAVGWYDPAWTFRLPVTITNANAFGVSYYQQPVSITGTAYTSVNAHSASTPKFADIRVTDSDGTTLLNSWTEDTASVANTVMLTVLVPQQAASSSKILYVYYGNAAASSVSSASGVFVSAHVPPLGSTPSVTVDSTASVFNGPGAMCRASNGNLVLLYTNGSNNFGTGGNLLRRISTDSGATWGAASTVIASSGGTSSLSMRVIKLTTLASGHIIGGVENDLTTNINNGHHFTLVSADNGSTWTVSAAITPPAAFTTSNGYGGIIELSPGGDLWWTWVGVRSGDTKNSAFIMRCASGNDPLTPANWAILGGTAAAATVFRDPAQSLTYTEADATVISAGVVLAAGREDTSGPLRTTLTTNTGSTWSASAVLTDVSGSNTTTAVSPELLTLANGDVLCTWGERARQSNSTYGTGASITTDRGTTWTAMAMPVQITGTPGVNDAAYTTTCQLADGTLRSAVSIASSSSVAIFYSFSWDEMWTCNCDNSYDDMEGASVGASWTLGANASQDAAFGHSGSKSMFLNNASGTGGVNAFGTRVLGAQNGGYVVRVIAMNWWYWINEDTPTAIYGLLRDGAGGVNGVIRLYLEDFAASPGPYESMFFNGIADTDWTTHLAIAQGVWGKKHVKAKHISNSSLNGELWYNNVEAGANGTNETTGTTNSFTNMLFRAGSASGTNAIQCHIDDWAEGEWVALDPTFAVGSEQTNGGTLFRRGSSGRAGSRQIGLDYRVSVPIIGYIDQHSTEEGLCFAH